MRVGALLLLAAAALLAGCGSSSVREADLGEPGPLHVHGLGVDPGEGTLYVATHTGLWKVPQEGAEAVRVGDARHDLMGFTVAGRDRFLASGHPDLRTDLPPLLGLVESRDGGESWEPVSLLGEADFHVLRVAGERVYGFDASGGRLLVSDDQGRSWEERAAPESLVDVAADPTDPDRLIAAGESALHLSGDGGATWRRLVSGNGLLAWPAPDALHLLGGAGTLWTSADAARTWRRAGDVGGAPAAFLAADARELYVALHDGAIIRSVDGGRTWSRYAGTAG